MQTIINKIEKLENRKKFYLTLYEYAKYKSITVFEMNFTTPGSRIYENLKWDKRFSEHLDHIFDSSIILLGEVNCQNITPEILFLAILKSGNNNAIHLLSQFNIDINDLVNKLEKEIQCKSSAFDSNDEFNPFSKRTNYLIKSAAAESEKMNFRMKISDPICITTSDILLVVVKNKNSTIGNLLNQVGLNYNRIKNKVIDNQHPFGVKKFKKMEKCVLSHINRIDKQLNILYIIYRRK